MRHTGCCTFTTTHTHTTTRFHLPRYLLPRLGPRLPIASAGGDYVYDVYHHLLYLHHRYRRTFRYDFIRYLRLRLRSRTFPCGNACRLLALSHIARCGVTFSSFYTPTFTTHAVISPRIYYYRHVTHFTPVFGCSRVVLVGVPVDTAGSAHTRLPLPRYSSYVCDSFYAIYHVPVHMLHHRSPDFCDLGVTVTTLHLLQDSACRALPRCCYV